MEMTLEEFQQEVKEVKNAGGRVRYSEEMKHFAVGYTKRKLNEGSTRARCSSELGIADPTLVKWMDEPRGGGFKRVKMSGASDNGIALTTPDGYRFEGLSIDDAAFLFRLR